MQQFLQKVIYLRYWTVEIQQIFSVNLQKCGAVRTMATYKIQYFYFNRCRTGADCDFVHNYLFD